MLRTHQGGVPVRDENGDIIFTQINKSPRKVGSASKSYPMALTIASITITERKVRNASNIVEGNYQEPVPNQRTISIEGSPGGGKTTIVQEVAKELGVGYIEKHMPTMLVEDFGILYPNGDDMLHYKLPDWFPYEGRDDIPDEGILCFDDRNQASADLQKVLANICQARNLHGKPMKKGWMVVSTGNRQSDRAGANRVLSHLRNRETVYELETHLDDWTCMGD